MGSENGLRGWEEITTGGVECQCMLGVKAIPGAVMYGPSNTSRTGNLPFLRCNCEEHSLWC